MRPQNPTHYSQTKEGKADAAAKGKGKGKGGGKGGGKGNGKGGDDEEKIRRLEANQKRLEAENRNLKAAKAVVVEESGEEDEDMAADDTQDKAYWERIVAEAEADGRHAERMLKKDPKSAKYRGKL